MANAADATHEEIVPALETWAGELIVSAFTAAEADYLILTRLGVDAELSFLDDLAATYSVVALGAAGIKRARALCAQYRDLELGLADASMVVLAEQWSTRSIATFDQHFRAVTPLQGGAFQLIPDDPQSI